MPPGGVKNSLVKERVQAVVEMFRDAAEESRQMLVSDFNKAAIDLLGITKEDALELAYQLDFEDGRMVTPGTMFSSPPRKKGRRGVLSTLPGPTMRTLYYDVIYHYAKLGQKQRLARTAQAKAEDGIKTHKDEGHSINNDLKEDGAFVDFAVFSNRAHAMAADLRKLCNSYAMDVAKFTKVAYAHDLRRSEAFSLLKKFGFVGGLAVSPYEKWFDESGNMRVEYMRELASVMSPQNTGHLSQNKTSESSHMNGTRNTPRGVEITRKNSDSMDASDLPDWARPELKSGRIDHRSAFSNSTTSPLYGSQRVLRVNGSGSHGVYNSIASRRKNTSEFPKVAKKFSNLHVKTDDDGRGSSISSGSGSEAESCPNSPDSPLTPDWGSSHTWRRKTRR